MKKGNRPKILGAPWLCRWQAMVARLMNEAAARGRALRRRLAHGLQSDPAA